VLNDRHALPRLVVPASSFPSHLAARGALTPVPTEREDGTIRIFLGMRGEDGRSRLGWADVDAEDGTLIATCTDPICELGTSGSFDENGMILGDIFHDEVSGALCACYVGFSNFPTAKFRAFSGLAMSFDAGESFKRCTAAPWLGPENGFEAATIVAAHSLRREGNTWSALVAVGWDWEWIEGAPYPRYQIHSASGRDLMRMDISPTPLVKPRPDLYRLGRPRHESWKGQTRIVATGGKVDGDYRAYAIHPGDDGWYVTNAAPYPVDISPGCSPSALQQAAYPATLQHSSGRTWVFFCGDGMGRDGIIASCWPSDV